MIKKGIAIVLSIYFMLSSTLLPKGDFALLTDLPAMYQRYTQIDDPKDIGVIDFMFDYLLNAEAILGADNYNSRPVPYNAVQFQHEANFLTCVIPHTYPQFLTVITLNTTHYISDEKLTPTAFANEILRPPLS